MREASKGRVFGGNAGLWLFHKKFRSKGSVSNEKRQQPLVLSVAVNDKDADHLEYSGLNEVQGSIQCSPNPIHFSISSSANDSNNDKLIATKSESLRTNVDIASINFTLKNHKRGVFGVRKRHFEATGSDSDTSVAMLSASSEGYNKKHRTRKIASSVKSTSQSDLSFISSQNHTSSFVGVECPDSSSAGSTGTSNTSRGTSIPNIVIADVANLTQQSESTSVFDFDKNPETQQLGCKTNLDVARQFFAQLDSDQTLLQIEDVRCGPEPPSTRKKRKVIRTTRGKLPSNVAKSEYHKYCQACQSSKVKPFSMERFLQQRSDYFRVGDVYDGMFDE